MVLAGHSVRADEGAGIMFENEFRKKYPGITIDKGDNTITLERRAVVDTKGKFTLDDQNNRCYEVIADQGWQIRVADYLEETTVPIEVDDLEVLFVAALQQK